MNRLGSRPTMPTPKRTAAKSKRKTIKLAKPAKKRVVAKTKRPAKAQLRTARVTHRATHKAKPRPAVRSVAHAAGCREVCRLCGGGCLRAGLHEQHRCGEHLGMSF